jgi:hypothetical protein
MTTRPASLREVAEQSDSVTDFGFNVREWLHEIRRFSSRPLLRAAIADEPAKLRHRFPEGKIADAWLAAYAEHLASRIGSSPPDWAFQAGRIADEPWFADELIGPKLRALAFVHSPLAFKRRNLFTPSVWLPLRLHRGRPRKAADQKRKSNSDRQRRFRERRKAELKRLRDLLAGQGNPPN